jgi:hypothetical protein
MRHFTYRTTLALGAVTLAAIAAGCGGGGSSGSLPLTSPTVLPGSGSTTAPNSTQQYADVTFTIAWPTTSASGGSNRRRNTGRHPDYISPSTQSITISVNGGTPLVVPNPNIGGGTTATSAPTTTATVLAPIGSDTFSVSDYDTTTGTGNLLAQNAITYTVVTGQSNVVPITLNGNLAKIYCSGGAPYTSPAGTIASASPQAFTITGPAGQINIIPEDADSNIIVSPGVLPSIALAAENPAQASITATSVTNTYVVNPLVVGTAVTLNASGTNLAGATITSSCTATRVLAMYVANHYENNLGSSSATGAPFDSSASVTVYPVTATGSATPTATIQGAATLLTAVQFPLVDNNGNIFVSNQGPMPGQAFGVKTGYVTIFGPASHDNAAPIATIPNLGEPQGLAFDSKGNLFVSEIDRVEEYPPSANGVRAAAVPSNTIIGSNTELGCYGIALDANDGIYLPCAVAMLYFPPSAPGVPATGNATPGILGPLGTVVAGSTTLTTTQSWMGVNVDPTSGDFALTGFNNNADEVSIYTASDLPSPGAGFATPVPTLSKDVEYNQPFGIAEDPSGQYYVTNFGNSTVEVFTSETTLELGVGTNLTLTGLNKPYGITVR